ncbi:MAG: esterase-like activity of phytase family protein [Leptolyngbya sp. PLA1]|nr:esterase-like activity of phytase family protein [Leptolyngbya sp. PLA1]
MLHWPLIAICSVAQPPQLVATAEIAWDARDRSGLESPILPGVPHDLLGSFGSGICRLEEPNLFAAVADRGPLDGATTYRCRVHVLRITLAEPLAGGSPARLRVELVETRLLADEALRPCIGFSQAYAPDDQSRSARLDPEAVAATPAGTLLIADEYGPFIDEYSMLGARLRRILPPPAFRIASPDGAPEFELPPHNTSGRQPNRGFEALAVSPDGSTAWALPQSPLIQDNALDASNKRVGINVRVLEQDLKSPGTRERVYQLHSPKHGISEALWVAPAKLLVLERDGHAAHEATFRRVYLADFAGATDVSTIAALPSTDLPPGIVPAKTRLVLDLCDPAYGLAGAAMPEKIEGLCFGPDLSDGRPTLLVSTDNDLRPGEPTRLWLFACDPTQF